MYLRIISDKTDCVSIHYEKRSMQLNRWQDGWRILVPGAEPVWIASAHIEMPEAIKRALIILTV